MLTRPGPFSFLKGRRTSATARAGLQVVPAEARHLRRARQIVAAAPVVNVHVGAALPTTQGDREPGAAFWALLDGPRTIGVVQQQRGICWALEPSERDDPRIVPALSEFLAQQVRFGEIIFGPESEVRAVVEGCRLRGIDLVELRRQEMMSCPVPLPAGLPAPGSGFALRPAMRRDLKWLLVAHGAMCREDLGVDQVARNPEGYSRYFQDLIRRRRLFVGEVGGRPVFKAEVALESRECWLIEGVFTEPASRGRGYASLATLWISELALSRGHEACLYVHRRNEVAIRVYRRIGYRTVCPWAAAILTRDGRRAVRSVEY